MNAPRRGATWADRLLPIPVLVLAFLALGVGGHLWHHLSDPDCENPGRGLAHPCSLCASLHASALAEDSRTAAAPALSPRDPILLPVTPDTPPGPRGSSPPRGPPLA